MSDQQPYEKPIKKRLDANMVISISVVIGIVIIIVCQMVFFNLSMQDRLGVSSQSLAGSHDGAGRAAILTSSDIQLVSCSDDDLSDAVAIAKPAIVNIDVLSSDVGLGTRRGGPPTLGFDTPTQPALQSNEETLGSGIIVDSRGYILTCYHLVRDYPKVYVTIFAANRRVYEAVAVEVDVANDLALLKITPDTPIPVATLANSDMVTITDPILTIGSPFGFEHTVTAGIVSDNARSIVLNGVVYRDLFQTDASINRGSAGGALINGEGEVIGINTAIASPSEYFAGISFAIPINKARPLMLKAIEG